MPHLVLVLVLAAALQSAACPDMCTCRTRPRDALRAFVAVACDTYTANLTAQLDGNTRALSLARLQTTQLQLVLQQLLEAEDALPYLARLTVTGTEVPDLGNLTLAGLPTLRSLDFTADAIETVHDSFLNLTELQTLDLSNNSIEAVKRAPFRTLRNLELLNLSANFLTFVASDGFSGLDSLKCLDLSGNKLALLDDAVFIPLLSLQYLNLSNNKLQVLNENCFNSLLKLQQLDVSWNHLVRVELGSLQLPSLARLLLAGNGKLGVSREPVLLVGTGQRLQTVDASRIGLKQVPAALTHSIRTLRLAGNAIKTVRCGDLDSYPLLQLLDFNSNGLELVEDDALGRLDSLSILYLTNNSMREIPKSLSEKLKVLHLEHNGIVKICRKDLQGLTALEVLLLNDNKISVIEEEAFNQLSSLVTLDISRNPIKLLEAGCLSGSMSLQVLRMSSIAVISPAKEVSFPLSSTEHLITLDLSGSPGLARQLLVDTAALAASRELQELDLSHTELDFIRSDLLHFLPQLRIFRIEGNRINCTQLQWLAAWMRRQDEPEYKKIVCASPPELWGTLLIDLQDTEISAANYITTTPQISTTGKRSDHDEMDSISVTPGNNASTDREMPSNETTTVEITREEDEEVLVTTISSGLSRKSHLGSPTLTNANEPEESPTNKVDRGSGKTEIPSNLFIASKEKTLSRTSVRHNDKLDELVPEVASDVDVNSNSSHQWNSSTGGEMSMFSAAGRAGGGLVHPGMLVLGAGAVAAAAVLALLAARFARRRRAASRLRREEEEDLEVSSLPGVTELW